MNKIKNKILMFVVVVMVITSLTTISVASQENKLSNEEIFELLVRESLYIDDDEVLTEDHFESVTYLSTTFHDQWNNWDGGAAIQSQQLTDLSLLSKLPNLKYLVFNPLKENPILPSNINVLNTLHIQNIELGDREGYGSQVDVTEEQRLALTSVYGKFLDSYDGAKLDSIQIQDDQISDYHWLVGLDMSNKVEYIYNAYTELSNNTKIKLNYEFSHYDEDGTKIYKMNFTSPLPMVLDLSNEGIIQEDNTYKNVMIIPSSNFNTIENTENPIFYDIYGNPVNEDLPGHHAVELFFSETLLEELQKEVKEEIEYTKQGIEYYRESIEELNKELLNESDPEIIEQIEDQIKDFYEYIIELEDLLARYETEGMSNIILYTMSINQEIADENSSSYIFLHNDYDIVLGREVPDFYTVSFESNGGTPVEDINNVEENTRILEPSAPTKQGYKFLGWYKESTLENEWKFDVDLVIEDITLYAKWEKIQVDPDPEEEIENPNVKPQNPEENNTKEDPNNSNIETGIKNGFVIYLILLVISFSLIILLKFKRKIRE